MDFRGFQKDVRFTLTLIIMVSTSCFSGALASIVNINTILSTFLTFTRFETEIKTLKTTVIITSVRSGSK